MVEVERKLDEIVEQANTPITQWFPACVEPLERKLGCVSEKKSNHMMDNDGWWEHECN